MNVLVSTGTDIQLPGRLNAEPLAEILADVADGRWEGLVESIRGIEYGSPEQMRAKKNLPYFTPSGLFRYRRSSELIAHSGHVSIDLDGLSEQAATAAIQKAIADSYCVCAFRSVTGRGARLIFKCPPCSPADHRVVYTRVAHHVRTVYGFKPDTSGSDVARACFVSFDRGLWLNPSAGTLPELLQLDCQGQTAHKESVSVCGGGLSPGDANTLAYGLGESRCPHGLPRPDSTVPTHHSLLRLGLDLVVQFRRHGLKLDVAEIERAFFAWWSTARRRRVKLRGRRTEYLAELKDAVRTAQEASWLDRVVTIWTRWTAEPDFPFSGSSDERLAWAIRQYCAERGTPDFFLSARCAATVTGTGFRAANDTIHRLVKAGVIKRRGKRQHARDAQEFRLLL